MLSAFQSGRISSIQPLESLDAIARKRAEVEAEVEPEVEPEVEELAEIDAQGLAISTYVFL